MLDRWEMIEDCFLLCSMGVDGLFEAVDILVFVPDDSTDSVFWEGAEN
jgi:hypothetical protein